MGRGRGSAGAHVLVAEVRTVNHRFLEIRVKAPHGLGELELRAQGLLRAGVDRGRVDATLAVAEGSAPVIRPRTDATLARAVVEGMRQVGQALGLEGTLSVADLIPLHELLLITEPAVSADELWPAAQAALATALEDLQRMRANEGQALKQDLTQRLDAVSAITAELNIAAPAAVTASRNRLAARVQDLLGDATVDPARLAQECVMLAERTDVAEELTRLAAHVGQMRKLMDGDAPSGRKLDFLCQELNREANTVASKCQDAHMLARVVDLKAEIERIREQVQNVA